MRIKISRITFERIKNLSNNKVFKVEDYKKEDLFIIIEIKKEVYTRVKNINLDKSVEENLITLINFNREK